MAELEFLENGHVYMLEGKRVPCVSDLCRFLSREIYVDAPRWQQDAAAERGTAVHEATVQLDAVGRATVEDEYAPYLQAYAAFLRDYNPEWRLTEKSFYSETDGFAGTIDRYGLLEGYRTLVDIKTTYTVHKPLCEASLNLYRRLLESNGHPVVRIYILHLQKSGKYKLIPFEISDRLPDSLLTLHKALEKKRRKGVTK